MTTKQDEFENTLYYGDNLTIMKEYIEDDSIDLIYLDPPFNSNRNYNIMYRTMTGQDVPEQVEAFCDTWELDAEKEQLARDMPIILRKKGYEEILAKFWEHLILALRNTQPKLLAYLVYMIVRLIEMQRILKPTGSIYLHCDPTASHYIKVIMDGIFGHENFENEIIWSYRTGGSTKKRFSRKHDILLFYSKSTEVKYFNNQKERAYTKSKNRKPGIVNYGASYTEFFEDIQGVYNLVNMRDVWDIPYINSQAKERLGYPTQKPIALLDRIIKASCPKDGIVFDPFCGCGTTTSAAHLNGRKWIGCDIAILSVKLIREVLKERYNLKEGKSYKITGIPITVEQAHMLFDSNPLQFEHWAVECVGGFCNKKQVGDKGIDGYIYFEEDKRFKRMVLSVKGGKNLSPSMVRDLRGTMEREGTEMAGLICLNKEPSKKMKEEAASAGQVEILGKQYDRLQILTVKNMLEDNQKFDVPNKVSHKEKTKQGKLLF